MVVLLGKEKADGDIGIDSDIGKPEETPGIAACAGIKAYSVSSERGRSERLSSIGSRALRICGAAGPMQYRSEVQSS